MRKSYTRRPLAPASRGAAGAAGVLRGNPSGGADSAGQRRSDGDKAVHLSAKLHDAPRAGYFTPYTVAAGVDTVAVPGFDIDLLGHGYFAQAEALPHDIHDLMRHSEPPARRQRLMPVFDEGKNFWRLKK